ncbi:MAG: dTDP-4-dehydrorhamnose reductase [Gammaproteobacteria bacterium]|nr:dTDP-4-dehydrorhamnose reductase [Gammaproteobacteria bacterium]
MKVLITGAQGQIGKELTHTAIAHGYEVYSVGREELDITKASNVDIFFNQYKPDIVINAAAYTTVDKAEEEQDIAYAINCDGTKNIAAACAEASIPLFHISTDYVFDGSKTEPYSEEDTISPLGIYGDSKWRGEEEIRKKLSSAIILRVAWVFGMHGNNFVKTMLRLGKDKNELNVVADQFGGPSPAKDIADTLIKLVTYYQKNNDLQWGTYHYCGSPKTSWYEFATEIFQQANEIGLMKKKIKVNPIPTTEYPTPAKRPENSMLDCTKISNIYNIDMPDWRVELKNLLTELK